MTTLTQEEAHRLFEYRDGVLYWKERHKNSRKAKGDMEAGTPSGHGYKKVTINQKRFYVHQLVFLMHKGYIPEVVDHIDGNSANNQIYNLRASNKSLNACNSKRNIKNTSGHKGVTWHKAAKKWMCQIVFNAKTKYLGLYEDFELACLVADEARVLYHGAHAKI
jgi:hypothetical protein